MPQATSSQVTDKLFTRLSRKAAILFNDRVDDRIDTAKSHLERIVTTDNASKASLS